MRKSILFIWAAAGFFMLGAFFSARLVLAADSLDKMESTVPLELDGTHWAVKVIPANNKEQVKGEQDVLIFERNRFISKLYRLKGYKPTSYSVSSSGADGSSFGAVQIKDDITAFWKGRIDGRAIRGSVHIQHPSGKNETYNYQGILAKGELKGGSKLQKSGGSELEAK
jgi:hypothetical protein